MRPTYKSKFGVRWDFWGWTVCFHRDSPSLIGLRPRLDNYGPEGWCLAWAWFEIGRARPAQ